MPQRVAVVGGGWAGLAAAVQACTNGHEVTLFEMAPRLGGRSRAIPSAEMGLDNGQHILIGAYVQTLRLMRIVGVDPELALLRTPLRLTDAQGLGLQLNDGAPALAFAAAVLRHPRWTWRDKADLLQHAVGWAARGFKCGETTTVAALTRGLRPSLRKELVEPLCVAALNTPAEEASAAVFLRVLNDALFSGRGASDLLLPRIGLSDCFPTPAEAWLRHSGARVLAGTRIEQLEKSDQAWLVNDEAFAQVVLATTPGEAARLTQAVAPRWAHTASQLRYEPIITVYLHCEGTRLPQPMVTLQSDATAPAQFVFDRGALGGPQGLLAFVISGAAPWLAQGIEAAEAAVRAQAKAALGHLLRAEPRTVRTLTEKRATFRCTPALPRPSMSILPGLWAAGDHVQGPYPATLEGAVRSGVAAANALAAHLT